MKNRHYFRFLLKHSAYLSLLVISILEVYQDKWSVVPLMEFQEVTKKLSFLKKPDLTCAIWSVPRTLLRMTWEFHLGIRISPFCCFGNLNQKEWCPWEGPCGLGLGKVWQPTRFPKELWDGRISSRNTGKFMWGAHSWELGAGLTYRQIAGRDRRGRKEDIRYQRREIWLELETPERRRAGA